MDDESKTLEERALTALIEIAENVNASDEARVEAACAILNHR